MENLLPYQGEVYYAENFIAASQQLKFYDFLLNQIPWENDKIIIYGKEIITKRKMAWFADNQISYTYSGKVKYPHPFNPILIEIKTLIEQYIQQKFNACLLNYYHDGSEYMGWHNDNEKDLASNGIIASISLGDTRKFSFKHIVTQQKIDLNLASGSLLLMQGETQQYWKHCLPKSAKIKANRINLTFRQMLTTNLSS